MITTIDLKAEFAKLKMLEGRTPTTPEAERKGAFGRLDPYRDGAIFTAKFAGTSAWERHPQGDEIVQIVDGATTLHLMTAKGRQSVTLSAGMMVIVPQSLAPVRGARRRVRDDRDAAAHRTPEGRCRGPADDGVSGE